MDRTAEALRIAASNAANARADADAAEARALALADQMQKMRSALDETRRNCEAVKGDHDKIASASRSVEGRLMRVESEKARIEKERRKIGEEKDEIKERAERIERVQNLLEDDLERERDELERMRKLMAERDAIEQARMDRTYRVENELREARAMLVEATSAAAETEATMAVLNDTIRELQQENKSLHDKIEDLLGMSSKERAKLNEALSSSETEKQKLRMNAASEEEELQKLKLDKAAAEKEIRQLKNRISNIERRLVEATTASSGNMMSTLTSLSLPESSYITPPEKGNDRVGDRASSYVVSIPPLISNTRTPRSSTKIPPFSSSGKENMENNRTRSMGSKKLQIKSYESSKCCLCLKGASGLMKACQCGKLSCDRRAHSICIKGRKKSSPSSVSHPGTPTLLLPNILCRHVAGSS